MSVSHLCDSQQQSQLDFYLYPTKILIPYPHMGTQVCQTEKQGKREGDDHHLKIACFVTEIQF